MFGRMTKKKTEKKARRPAGRPKKETLEKRFMVRCTDAELERWALEAKRRGFARGAKDSGVGQLARQALNQAAGLPFIVADQYDRPVIPPGEHVLGPAGEVLASRPQVMP